MLKKSPAVPKRRIADDLDQRRKRLERIPEVREPEDAAYRPAPEQGLDAFCGHLARVGEITLAEAEDLVLTLLLPAWLDRRTMIAAE